MKQHKPQITCIRDVVPAIRGGDKPWDPLVTDSKRRVSWNTISTYEADE